MRSVKPGALSESATAAALAKPVVKTHPRSLEARGVQTWADLQQQKKAKRARLIGALIAVAVVLAGIVAAGVALARPR